MAKLTCPCGAQLSNVTSPNTIEGYMVNNMQLINQMGETIETLDLISIGRGIWECYECGRLAFDFPKIRDSTVKWYLPEDGKPGRLMHVDT